MIDKLVVLLIASVGCFLVWQQDSTMGVLIAFLLFAWIMYTVLNGGRKA